MIEVFEKIKDFFGYKEKKFSTPKGSNKAEKEDSSLCSLLDYQERQNYKFSKQNAKANADSIKLSVLNPIYTAINISLIVILLGLKVHHNVPMSHDKVIKGMSIPCYFELYKINPVVFHIYHCLSGVLGYGIIYVLYSSLKLKLEYIKDKMIFSHVKLVSLLLFGSLFNLCTFVESFIPYIGK
jgi:hypothetical protein